MFHLFQSSVAASVFMLQVASVLSGCCLYFHTCVASVYSRCFICFRHMLHSSVFMLHVFRDVWSQEAPGMGHGKPVASGSGVQCAGGCSRGHDVAGVRLQRRGEQMGMGAGCVDGGRLVGRASGRPIELIPFGHPCVSISHRIRAYHFTVK